MTTSYLNPKDRFAASSKMVWFSIYSAVGLQLLSLAVAGKDAIPVLTVGVPSLIGAAMAWSGITNWAEVRGMDVGYGAPTDLRGQTVNVNPPSAPPTKPVVVEGGE